MTDTDRIDELVRTCARIEAKVDLLDAKLDGTVERVAVVETRQRLWTWLGSALIVAFLAAVVPMLLA